MLSAGNQYGAITLLPSMALPIDTWCMQSGGYIFMRQGENRIRIDPDEMVQLLLGYSNDYYIQRIVSDDEGDGEHLEPIVWERPAKQEPHHSETGGHI